MALYNNLYRKIPHVPPRSSASKMFVDNNIPNFEALFRKVFSFTSRLSVSTHSIIRATENCWLIKQYVIWKPWHIEKLFFIIIYHVMFILYCVVFSTFIHLISFIVSIFVFLDNILYNFIFIYGCFSLK